MGFLKAALVCQLLLVLGMASTSDASLLLTPLRLILAPIRFICSVIKYLLSIPFRILCFVVRCIGRVAVAILRGIGTVILHFLSNHQVPLVGGSRVRLVGSGGLLSSLAYSG